MIWIWVGRGRRDAGRTERLTRLAEAMGEGHGYQVSEPGRLENRT